MTQLTSLCSPLGLVAPQLLAVNMPRRGERGDPLLEAIPLGAARPDLAPESKGTVWPSAVVMTPQQFEVIVEPVP